MTHKREGDIVVHGFVSKRWAVGAMKDNSEHGKDS